MHTPIPPSKRAPARAGGFSLVELMVAIAIGLIIMAGMTTLFVNNSAAQAEIEKVNRQIENGRYAMSTLTNDLRNAGFLGEYSPAALATPLALPDPCAVTEAALVAALPLHVQGVDSVGSASLGCITDAMPGTDAIVVRHARTCVLGAANCGGVDDPGPFFQASLCNNKLELDSGDAGDHYALAIAKTAMTRTRKDCLTTAVVRRYLVHIYYVANNGVGSDGIPTLKRAELEATDGGALEFNVVPLVEGIENLQLQYGIDNALPADGVADSYSASPATAQGWRDVVSVKISLLARNLQASPGYKAGKTYTLGADVNGNDIVVTKADGYKRHVFQAVASMANPVGRRMP
ncbi:PilW family protein [Massilia glaciei]|nr:PilW family protein [Massilia glaciei]